MRPKRYTRSLACRFVLRCRRSRVRIGIFSQLSACLGLKSTLRFLVHQKKKFVHQALEFLPVTIFAVKALTPTKQTKIPREYRSMFRRQA